LKFATATSAVGQNPTIVKNILSRENNMTSTATIERPEHHQKIDATKTAGETDAQSERRIAHGMHRNLNLMKRQITNHLSVALQVREMAFHSPSEWWARGERVCNGAVTVLFLGEYHLHDNMPCGDDFEVELSDIALSFGFECTELRDSCVQFVPLKDYDFEDVENAHFAARGKADWQRKDQLVKAAAEHRCQDCDSDGALVAYHCLGHRQHDRLELWQHPLSDFRAICKNCESIRTKAEIRLQAEMGRLSGSELEMLLEVFRRRPSFFAQQAGHADGEGSLALPLPQGYTPSTNVRSEARISLDGESAKPRV
jgi:hypothetical protein